MLKFNIKPLASYMVHAITILKPYYLNWSIVLTHLVSLYLKSPKRNWYIPWFVRAFLANKFIYRFTQSVLKNRYSRLISFGFICIDLWFGACHNLIIVFCRTAIKFGQYFFAPIDTSFVAQLSYYAVSYAN